MLFVLFFLALTVAITFGTARTFPQSKFFGLLFANHTTVKEKPCGKENGQVDQMPTPTEPASKPHVVAKKKAASIKCQVQSNQVPNQVATKSSSLHGVCMGIHPNPKPN